jgi:type IV pilus assembly protein PilC
MLFNYKAIGNTGEVQNGTIESINVDAAIAALQKRGLIISDIRSDEKKGLDFLSGLSFLNRISTKDVVILSRQMSTLFQAQISALRIFRLLGGQTENKALQKRLLQVADDIQGGLSISNALAKHPDVFSDFYVNMVKSGEESGKLDETFGYLADYLDRSYQTVSKAKNALVYPAFVIITFVGVMVLMLTVIIPKISIMITESGQDIPIYTKIVIWISDLFIHYGILLAIIVAVASLALWRYSRTKEGEVIFSRFQLDVPYVGSLYRKLYLARICDNLNTMIVSGIPILRTLEITSSVVDNRIFKDILNQTIEDVRGGSALSASFSSHKEIPGIMVQMIKVGEESGELGSILATLAKFYDREVNVAVDTLVGLIEPVMIVILGLGVGVLLTSVLMPIYNIASAG